MTHLQDWRWRDVGKHAEESSEKYSKLQIKYFETPPADRFKLIDELIASGSNTDDNDKNNVSLDS